jgi:D-serine deaminase-like pyridoxal phosphate-dependent protein
MPLAAVDTPALLIDLDALERNLRRLAGTVAASAVRLRPHAKTHKCPVIARRQMALGAVGVCCQKVGEAEALVYGGVDDVLVSNEIVGTSKLHRLASLASQARVAVCADDPGNVRALDEVAASHGVRLSVLVEINVGADRCGVEPGQPALDLARLIEGSRALRFAGLQAYHGAAQHIRDHARRREAIGAAAHKAAITVDLLKRHGLPCETVTGAGTGTFPLEAATGVYTELQAGSYIFMDADYARNLGEDGRPWREFEQSLHVWATVMSRPARDRAIVDAGLKALSVDSGMPQVEGMPDVEFSRASDEHGKLVLHDPGRALAVGDKVRLIPGHCDPTVNLHDWYVVVQGGRVQALWPITARGALF